MPAAFTRRPPDPRELRGLDHFAGILHSGATGLQAAGSDFGLEAAAGAEAGFFGAGFAAAGFFGSLAAAAVAGGRGAAAGAALSAEAAAAGAGAGMGGACTISTFGACRTAERTLSRHSISERVELLE